MNSPAPHQNAALYSLVDWLVLSGISAETGEISAYEALQKRQAERNVAVEKPAETEKPSAAPKKSLQQKHEIPVFNSIEELNKFCTTWKDFNLAKTASRCVTGNGDISPLLYIVTDMPEDEEDRNGEAFTSPANQIIRKALSFTDIPADRIYFSYLSKWRTPGKRALTPYEMEACANLLQQEIRLLAPGFVLTLGESARETVLNGDSVNELGKISYGKIYKKQMFSKEMTILPCQKAEFLVKNNLMKKNFWFGLLELANLIRANGEIR
jgi:uracil-DNA glycosylase family 4